MGLSSSDHTQSPIVRPSSASHQPYVRPSMRPKTRKALVTTDSSAPTPSMVGGCSARVAGTNSMSPTRISTPSGMLMPNAHRHEKSVVSQPPRSGPTAAMPPIVAPHTAKAMPRSRPTKVALSVDSVDGRIIAPPTPCTTRAAMSALPESASAAQTEARAKITRPSTSMRRRPNRSPIVPKTTSRAAKTSV